MTICDYTEAGSREDTITLYLVGGILGGIFIYIVIFSGKFSGLSDTTVLALVSFGIASGASVIVLV